MDDDKLPTTTQCVLMFRPSQPSYLTPNIKSSKQYVPPVHPSSPPAPHPPTSRTFNHPGALWIILWLWLLQYVTPRASYRLVIGRKLLHTSCLLFTLNNSVLYLRVEVYGPANRRRFLFGPLDFLPVCLDFFYFRFRNNSQGCPDIFSFHYLLWFAVKIV